MKRKTSNEKISIRKINSTEEFHSLEGDWGQLLAQNHVQSAFLSWEWLYSWWEIYNEGHELWLLTAWNNNELYGVMPLMISTEKRRGFSFRVLHPLGTPLGDASGFLLKDKSEAALFAMSNYLLQHKKDWDTLLLNNFTQSDIVLTWLKSYLNDKGMIKREKISEHFYIHLKGKWDEYSASLSSRFRKNLRRATRNAAKSGVVSFIYFPGKKAKWEVFQKIIKLDQYSKYPIIYQSIQEQEFHKKLFKRMQEKEQLVLFLLEINDIPLAYEYGFIQNGKYESWRASYDYRFDPKVSIGTLLSKLVTEKSFELDYKEIDFLRGTESYKLKWKPASRNYTKIRFIHKKNLLPIFIYIWFPKFKNWITKKNSLLQFFIKRG
ncbi:MAG: GNAT family N-acetyltransferase [Anaerolineae bacterium]|nr:GNAT family N-acetyltransferase [Anaerolineae bacterium]MBT7075384.1 GNAT family N-acetyltransferase [Anaerolineae bacterium]MBT7781367.1 GNAT family N-acetyltransferase [Anaerolineae bacterium]